jgi:formylglycine-generating enzyme required for sulfatase activity
MIRSETAPSKSAAPKMAWIPPGEFMIGTDEVDEEQEAMQLGFPRPWFEDEHPLRNVNLHGFYLDLHEVTRQEYLEFLDATEHAPPDWWTDLRDLPDQGRHPVTGVDWYDADDFCRWAGKRLPTEEEWEKAARGPDGFRYPWGNSFDLGRAHLSPGADALFKTVPVESYPTGASPYGLFDMVGNVWEWTDSWYLPYPESTLRNKDFGMKYRVVRGLSYHSLGHYPEGAYERVVEIYARASTRSYDPPGERLEDLGFRCAKSGERP